MEVKAACREAAAYCASRGTDLARLALQYSMLHDGVASHLVGMASPEQVALHTITAVLASKSLMYHLCLGAILLRPRSGHPLPQMHIRQFRGNK